MNRSLVLIALMLLAFPAFAHANCDTRHFYNNSRTNWTVSLTDGRCSIGAVQGLTCTAGPGQAIDLSYPNTGNNIFATFTSSFLQITQRHEVTIGDCYIHHAGDTGRLYLNDSTSGDANTCHDNCGVYIAPLLSSLPQGINSGLVCALGDDRGASACIARAYSTRRDNFTIPIAIDQAPGPNVGPGPTQSQFGPGTPYSGAAISRISFPASANLANCLNVNDTVIRCTYGPYSDHITLTIMASSAPSSIFFNFRGHPNSDVRTSVPMPLIVEAKGLDSAFASVVYRSTIYISIFPQNSNMQVVWGPQGQDTK